MERTQTFKCFFLVEKWRHFDGRLSIQAIAPHVTLIKMCRSVQNCQLGPVT